MQKGKRTQKPFCPLSVVCLDEFRSSVCKEVILESGVFGSLQIPIKIGSPFTLFESQSLLIWF